MKHRTPIKVVSFKINWKRSYLLLVWRSSVSLSHTDVRCNNGSLQAQCEMHLLDLQRPWRLWASLSSRSFTGGLSGGLSLVCSLIPVWGPGVVLVDVADVVVVKEVRDSVVFIRFCAVKFSFLSICLSYLFSCSSNASSSMLSSSIWSSIRAEDILGVWRDMWNWAGREGWTNVWRL